MMLGQLDIHMQKNEIDLNFKPHARINFKRITDLNIRAKTTKLLEEWIHVNLCDLGLGNGFLDMAPTATKEKKWKIGMHQNWTFVFQRILHTKLTQPMGANIYKSCIW